MVRWGSFECGPKRVVRSEERFFFASFCPTCKVENPEILFLLLVIIILHFTIRRVRKSKPEVWDLKSGVRTSNLRFETSNLGFEVPNFRLGV